MNEVVRNKATILIDLNDIKIRRNLPMKRRITSFKKQVKNPYSYKVGDIAVNVSFGNYKCLKNSFCDAISFHLNNK